MKNIILQRIFKYILPTEINYIMTILSYSFNPWEKYLKDIFSYVGNARIEDNYICDNPLLMIHSLEPLPRKMINIFHNNIYEKIKFDKDVWKFEGINKSKNRCIVGNCCIPSLELSHVPFSFSYIKNNKRYIRQSNIYYWEIEVEKEPFRSPWYDSCISMGFGKIGTSVLNQVGWGSSTIGYHSDDGHIFYQNEQIDNFSNPWTAGDIIGCGMIYNENNKKDIFFTKNGKMVKLIKDIQLPLSMYYPILCIDSFYGIKVNFGETEFSFPIDSMINNYDMCYVLSSKNHFLESKFDINIYKWIPKTSQQYIIVKINKMMEDINLQLA